MTESHRKDAENDRSATAQTLQRRRAITFGVAATLAVVFVALGLVQWRVLLLLAICAVGAASALGLYLLHRRGLAVRWHRPLDIAWNVLDLALITAAMLASGGARSPWFIFYVSNTAGAALALGGRAAILFGVAGGTAYLASPVLLGQTTFMEPAFRLSLATVLILYGATYFLIRAFAELQARRAESAHMHEAQVRAIDELSRMTNALEQRTRELADAQVRIREADRLKSQFLANMSHELRTPLNSIIGFSEVLLTRLQTEMPPKYLKFLQNINSAGQHLLGIINDILDLSKIEAGNVEVHLEHLSIGSVVDGVSTVMKGTARKHDITLDVQVPADLPLVEGDPVKVKQIVYNLVANAVKFSRDGSTVTIVARRLTEAESPVGVEAVSLSVADHGIGIDPRFHRLIFEEFVQVDNTPSRLFGGSGLGLALVRRFVELHGGVITLDSALGRGSTFSVTLPCDFKGAPGPAAPRPETLRLPGEVGRRVLVVEDDPTSYEVISRRLTEASFVPVRARTSREALELARTLRPAAITLDIILPGADGWEVLKALKADSTTADIPVVIVSVVDNRELGLALGAQDYLLKPVDGPLLVRRLRELLPRPSGDRQRILLIDDDPTLHEIMEEKLRSSGFVLDHAMSGREGIELVRRQPPVLIVLDLMMQEMDGFEVAKVLREEPTTAQIPIVVFTAKDVSSGDKERLAGKVAALVEKGRTSHSGIVPIIRDVLNRQTPEARRGRG